jgi:hypothetical protein
MKYYKNSTNNIFAYEADGSQDHVIPTEYVSITKQQADELIAINDQLALDNLTYTEKRRIEYPPVIDYIDAMVKGDQVAIDKYIADCKAVKAKYPKP